MSERCHRSGKSFVLSEQPRKNPKEKVVNNSNSANMAVAADVLQELKSMRANLKGHITKLGNELKVFQCSTNERLLRIESIMSKVEEIDDIKNKQQQQLEGDVESIKESLNFVNISTEDVESLRKSNEELKKKVEHLERYSRDFNIRILGVNETQGEDCLGITIDLLSSLGFEDAGAEVENAHPTGKKRDDENLGTLLLRFTAGLEERRGKSNSWRSKNCRRLFSK